MQKRSKIKLISLSCCFATILFVFSLVFAAEITVVGEVNYLYQIMADSQIYEVANTAMGDDLVINYIAKKVEVSGTIEEKGEKKIIIVKSFRVVPEKK